MSQRTCRGLIAIILLSGTAAGAAAQTPDYRRAEQFLGWNTALMVSGDVVNPTWLPDGNRFCVIDTVTE